MTVNNCQPGDEGKYACNLEKQPDNTETIIELSEFQYKFTKILKSARLIEKDTLTLACELNDARGDVKWFKGEDELQGDKRIEIVKDGRKRKITIKDAKVSDAGAYSCVSNADKTLADISVNYQNKFLKKLKDTDMIEREKVIFEVELQDQTAPTEWFLNGEQLKEGEGVELKNLGGGKHQLIFPNVRMDQVGKLECKSGDLASKCDIAVLKGETKPIVDAPETVEAPISGGSFEIVIPYRIDGTRKSPVLAKIVGPDGKTLGKNDAEIIIKDDRVIIKLKKPSRAMSGPYKVTIENAQGAVESPIKLNMMTPPSAPQNLELKDLFDTNFTLKWAAPADDGGSPVVGYKIEVDNQSEKSSWYAYSPKETDVVQIEKGDKIGKVVSEIDRYIKASITRYKVDGFRKGQVMRVRVRACNHVGESEPANIADRITMKNPWNVPNAPKDPEITDWTETTLSVQWKAPDSDGGSPILGYVVEYKEKMASTWKSFFEPDPKKLTSIIPELRTGASYVVRVRARNREGDSEPSTETPPKTAKARFVKPFFVDVGTMQNITIRKGQMGRWDIAYGGEPPPTAEWLFSKGRLGVAPEVPVKADGDHITLETYEGNTVLTIKKAVRTDSGRYFIRVKNEVGSCEHKADLLVLDKPSPPDGEPEATKIRCDCATVAFRPPKDDGGSPILGYIIEKMDTETGRWVGAGECGPESNEFEVKNLTKGKRYKLRVKAYNKEGESEPSEMSDTFVAQNPYGKFFALNLTSSPFDNTKSQSFKKLFFSYVTKNQNSLLNFFTNSKCTFLQI